MLFREALTKALSQFAGGKLLGTLFSSRLQGWLPFFVVTEKEFRC
jgi:hypothetical protein